MTGAICVVLSSSALNIKLLNIPGIVNITYPLSRIQQNHITYGRMYVAENNQYIYSHHVILSYN